MNIPAYACRPLCIGRTYDARNSSAGIDIFPSGFPTKTINKYRLIFKYKKVQNSKDVKDLLDISGQISLKIKAGILKAEGSGEYLSDSNRKEGTTEILAVLKYITVTESMDGIVDVVEKVARGEIKHGLGTHYVRSVSYGAEMTASLSIETSSDSNTYDIQGSVDGDIGVIKAKVVDLKSQLQSVATQSSDQTNIAIKCYTTGIKHDKSPTSLDDLVNLIEQFMSSLERIDEGRGVPLEFELMPIETAMQTSESLVKYSLFTITDDLEQCFDDLRDAQGLVDKYENTQKDNDEDDDDDVVHFCEQITEVMGQFKEAISLINSFEGKDRVDACLKAYRDALDGRNIPRKFCKKWKRILKTKKPEAAAEASSTVQKPEAAAEASSTVQKQNSLHSTHMYH